MIDLCALWQKSNWIEQTQSYIKFSLTRENLAILFHNNALYTEKIVYKNASFIGMAQNN